eukprot:scaffold1940_cov312-Prasinococcus_capsulatus_cf.AAC.4
MGILKWQPVSITEPTIITPKLTPKAARIMGGTAPMLTAAITDSRKNARPWAPTGEHRPKDL